MILQIVDEIMLRDNVILLRKDVILLRGYYPDLQRDVDCCRQKIVFCACQVLLQVAEMLSYNVNLADASTGKSVSLQLTH